MTTTFDNAVDNAARILKNREAAMVRSYGHLGESAPAVAEAWIKLAKVISEGTNDRIA